MNKHFTYTPHIDGLRAIAIIAVVLYHFDFGFLSGGFIGVDIFFVISGYLITSIIMPSIDASKFSFADFYLKRARRILPSLFFVSFFTFLIGFWTLNSNEFIYLTKNISSGIFFHTNVWLERQSGYFDITSDLKPMLHFWSLSTEEQFYFIWPLLLVFSPKSKRRLFLYISTVLSFGLCLYLTFKSQSEAFYMIYSRFWEMSLGGLVAVEFEKIQLFFRNLTIRKVLAFLSLVTILVLSFLLDKSSLFPGFPALLVCLSTASLIIFIPDVKLLKNVFESKAFLLVGLISYTLYLTHWPLLYFLKVFTNLEPSFFEKILTLILSFLLSYCLTFSLESYFKKQKPTTTINFINIICSFVLGITCVYFGKIGNNNISDKSTIVGEMTPALSKDLCKEINISGKPDWCRSSINSSHVDNFLIIGDSHSGALYSSLLLLPEPFNHWSIIGKAGCTPHVPKCRDFIDSLKKHIETTKYKYILFSFSSRLLLDDQKSSATTITQEMLDFISYVSKYSSVIFIESPPSITDQPQLCLDRPFSLRGVKSKSCYLSKENFNKKYTPYLNLIEKIKNIPFVIIMRTSHHFCDSKHCFTTKNGKSLYSYSDHISDYGGSILAKDILQHIQ